MPDEVLKKCNKPYELLHGRYERALQLTMDKDDTLSYGRGGVLQLLKRMLNPSKTATDRSNRPNPLQYSHPALREINSLINTLCFGNRRSDRSKNRSNHRQDHQKLVGEALGVFYIREYIELGEVAFSDRYATSLVASQCSSVEHREAVTRLRGGRGELFTGEVLAGVIAPLVSMGAVSRYGILAS
jgi:hypothetical protein